MQHGVAVVVDAPLSVCMLFLFSELTVQNQQSETSVHYLAHDWVSTMTLSQFAAW